MFICKQRVILTTDHFPETGISRQCNNASVFSLAVDSTVKCKIQITSEEHGTSAENASSPALVPCRISSP